MTLQLKIQNIIESSTIYQYQQASRGLRSSAGNTFACSQLRLDATLLT